MSETLQKLSKYMYTKGLNMSSGKKSTPAQEGIEEGTLIDIVNIGIEVSTGNTFVRATFRGRKTFFQIPIKHDSISKWAERFNKLHQEATSDIDDSEEIDF